MFKLSHFDGLALDGEPFCADTSYRKRERPLAGIASGLMGGVDTWNGNRVPSGLATITQDFRIVDASYDVIRANYEALYARVGKAGQLDRQFFDSSGDVQHLQARLLSIQEQRDGSLPYGGFSADFGIISPYWFGAARVASMAGAFGNSVNLVNDGNMPTHHVVITIAVTSDTLDGIGLTGGGNALSWFGSVSAGETLTINSGTGDVRIGTTNAFNGGMGGHEDGPIFQVPVGTTPITIGTYGGSGTPECTVTFDYQDAYRL